jgi:hypothetical protein
MDRNIMIVISFSLSLFSFGWSIALFISIFLIKSVVVKAIESFSHFIKDINSATTTIKNQVPGSFTDFIKLMNQFKANPGKPQSEN